MSEFPRAVVREIDGKLVLDDPDALAMIKAIDNANYWQNVEACRKNFLQHTDRVRHFLQRAREKNLSPGDAVIVMHVSVVIDVDHQSVGAHKPAAGRAALLLASAEHNQRRENNNEDHRSGSHESSVTGW